MKALLAGVVGAKPAAPGLGSPGLPAAAASSSAPPAARASAAAAAAEAGEDARVTDLVELLVLAAREAREAAAREGGGGAEAEGDGPAPPPEDAYRRATAAVEASSSLATRQREVAADAELAPALAEALAGLVRVGVERHASAAAREAAMSALDLAVELTDPEEYAAAEVSEATVVQLRVADAVLVKDVLGAAFALAALEGAAAEAVQKAVQLLDNLSELFPTATAGVADRTPDVAAVLVRAVEHAPTSAAELALAASEALAVLLGNDDTSGLLSSIAGGVGGPAEPAGHLAALVRATLRWQTTEPGELAEAEWCENTHDVLCRIMLGPNASAQRAFREVGGLEACVGARGFASGAALKTLDFALQHCRDNCRHFVDCGGLGVVFPALMGRPLEAPAGGTGKRRKQTADATKALERHAASVVSSLALWLPSDARATEAGAQAGADSARFKRFCNKLTERGNEKLGKVVETARAFSDGEFVAASLFGSAEAEGEGEGSSQEADAEEDAQRYLLRLGEGLERLEWAATTLAAMAVHGPAEAAEAARKALSAAEWGMVSRVLLTKAALGCEAPDEGLSLEAKSRLAELVEGVKGF